jgi:hypothetical protein
MLKYTIFNTKVYNYNYYIILFSSNAYFMGNLLFVWIKKNKNKQPNKPTNPITMQVFLLILSRCTIVAQNGSAIHIMITE